MRPLLVMLCAVALLALAVAGLWAQSYRDNWAQWAGLWGMVIAMVAVFCPSVPEVRALGLLEAVEHRVNDVGARDLLVMASALLFGAGTACKVWRHRKQRPGGPPAEAPYKLEPDEMRHVAGGSKQ